jgi:hypothetical protein
VVLPAHIIDRIRSVLATTDTKGLHMDHEAARHGGIALLGTIGATWLLRPDGTFWDVDDDFGRPIGPLPENLHVPALVSGTRRYPWLAELLPVRPHGATTCPTCRGLGEMRFASARPTDAGVLCPDCRALGWRPAA